MAIPASDGLIEAVGQTIRVAGMPGMVIAVSRDHDAVEHAVVGTDAAGARLSSESLFPVTSITKLATALAVLRLVDLGEIALDDVLVRFVPECEARAEGTTIRRLLSHTAAVAATPEPEPTWRPSLEWPEYAAASVTTPQQHRPGAVVWV